MKKDAYKAAWLAKAEALIIEKDKRYAGRVEWYDLIHAFNIGQTPEQAAQRYIEVHQ